MAIPRHRRTYLSQSPHHECTHLSDTYPLFGGVQILSPEAVDTRAETPLHQPVVHFQAATTPHKPPDLY
eukprot:6833663-Pyramimonas_sp.AAC.1